MREKIYMSKSLDDLTPIQFVKTYNTNFNLVLAELRSLTELVKNTKNFDELRGILPRIFEMNSKISQLRKECNQNSKLIAIHTDESNKTLLNSKNQLERATKLYFAAKANLSSKEKELNKLTSVLITAGLMLPFILSSTLDVWIKFGYPVLVAVIIRNFYSEQKIKKDRAKNLQKSRQILRDIAISNRTYSSFVYANADSSLELIEQLFDSINELEDMSAIIEQIVSKALKSGDAHD